MTCTTARSYYDKKISIANRESSVKTPTFTTTTALKATAFVSATPYISHRCKTNKKV
jgi:hypothetical protein